MSYNRGQGQFGRGNIWAGIKQTADGETSINLSDQAGYGALQVAKATYDFALDGGVIGLILPVNSPVIPAGAVVLGAIIFPITLPTGGASTIAIGVGAQAAVIKGATAIATYVAGAPLVALPVWASGFFLVTTSAKISFTVAGANLTAGKIAVHIVYVMGGE